MDVIALRTPLGFLVRTHMFASDAGHALQRSASPITSNPIVQPFVGEIVEYFACCRARVKIGIGFILKLPSHEPAMRLCKFDGLVDHSDSALGGGRYDDLGSKEPHKLTPLHAKWLRHRDDERVSLRGAHHGETNSCISAGRFDDCLTRLKISLPFRRLDYSEGQAVLH
jgi:hypothetical protein